MNSETEIVQRAEQFARSAHAGMLLQSGGLFVTHLEDVTALVRESGATWDELAAAWLHDVVEDTTFTVSDIRNEFGEVIAAIVDGLTDPPDFVSKPNKLRKRLQAERIRDKGREVKHVKIADQTVNVFCMGFKPPLTWSITDRLDYVEGAQLIVEECRGVNPFLDKKFEDAYRATMRALQG